MKKIEINGNDIFYKLWKSEDNLIKGTFVILHGWGGSSKSWEYVGKNLCEKGYDVFIPDLPGFGETKIDKVYNVDGYVSLVEEFLSKLGLDNIILLAHSNGGRIAINIAYNSKVRLKKLFLNNAAGTKYKVKIKNTVFGLIGKFLKLCSFLPGYKLLRKYLYKLVGGHDYLNASENALLRETFVNMLGSDCEDIMPKLTVPCTIIWGENDTYTPLVDGKKMHKLIKGSNFVLIQGEKHGIHLHNPDKLIFSIINNL